MMVIPDKRNVVDDGDDDDDKWDLYTSKTTSLFWDSSQIYSW